MVRTQRQQPVPRSARERRLELRAETARQRHAIVRRPQGQRPVWREHWRQRHDRLVAAIARCEAGHSCVIVDTRRRVAACRSLVHRCWHGSPVAKRDSRMIRHGPPMGKLASTGVHKRRCGASAVSRGRSRPRRRAQRLP